MEKCGRPGQDTDGSRAHALSMLDCYTKAPPYYVVRTVGLHCLVRLEVAPIIDVTCHRWHASHSDAFQGISKCSMATM